MANLPKLPTPIQSHSIGYDYIIYKDGEKIIAKDGKSGQVIDIASNNDDSGMELIQSIIDSMAETNTRGSVFFGTGIYNIYGTLKVYNGIGLVGAQTAWSTYACDKVVGATFRGMNDCNIIEVCGQYNENDDILWFSYLSNLHIVGNTSYSNQNGVVVKALNGDIYDIFIDHVLVHDVGVDGFQFYNGKVWADHLYTESNRGNGIYTQTETLYLADSYIYGNYKHGIYNYLNGQNIIFNNRIWVNHQHGIYIYPKQVSPGFTKIALNHFLSNSYSNANTYSNIFLWHVETGEIIGNTFIDRYNTTKYHIDLIEATTKVIIADNNFMDTATSGVIHADHSLTGTLTVGANKGGDCLKNKGINTQSGDGTTTQFTIPHGLVSEPSNVIVIPASADASGDYYITKDDTNIYINYISAPPAGTDNLSWYWKAEV